MLDYWGMDHGAFYRWVKRGTLLHTTADAICIKLLGTHPSIVYGEMWWEIKDARTDNGYHRMYNQRHGATG